MTDTDEPQQPADTASRLIDTRVCIDDMLGPYDAKLNPNNRWNGWLFPNFTLDTVRKIAARTQEAADEYGHDVTDTIYVIDGGIDREGEPARSSCTSAGSGSTRAPRRPPRSSSPTTMACTASAAGRGPGTSRPGRASAVAKRNGT
ncbi:hypothetical protein [Streptomyces sp. NPDC005262]|uniref:hypothetical protein n=1 Tax=Streptomyces sp. NPDC005262 TaxID=3364710 RepID=UPI0036964AF0